MISKAATLKGLNLFWVNTPSTCSGVVHYQNGITELNLNSFLASLLQPCMD